jgi:hypothetical protein
VRAALAAVAVLTAALLTAGCTGPASLQTDGPTARPEPDAVGSAPPEDRATTRPAAPPATATACGDELATLDTVISEQLAAFAADDWDRAFSLTSQQFRASGVDANGLREIVTSGYAAAADAERHDVLGCVITAREAQVLIEVTARDGTTLGLVYLMTREDGRWRISGAVEHGTGGSEPATIPA